MLQSVLSFDWCVWILIPLLSSVGVQRDYYKNYAEQLRIENSKKWRLQERGRMH